MSESFNITLIVLDSFISNSSTQSSTANVVDSCGFKETESISIEYICPFIIPNIITPNNDGFNDYLFFPCITGVENVKLMVWHRWGLIIYENFNYQNDWQGILRGELLPAGTYWYSLEYTDPETKEQVKEVNYFMIIN